MILLLVAGSILTAGCIGQDSVQPAMVQEEAYSPSYYAKGVSGESYEAASDSVARSAMAPVPTPGAVPEPGSETEQKIIRTADIRLEVVNVSASARDVQEVALQYEGMVQSSSVYAGSQNRYSGTVVIRVPAERFDPVLATIHGMGKVLSSSVSARDVTEEYVDLTAQRNALANQLIQYNRLLTKGENVSEILEVQREIERVQVELDRIDGRMRYLDSRTSYSTITVNLAEPTQVKPPEGYSFPSVINDAITGFIETVVWLFVFIFTLLPLIILGGVVYWVWKRTVKKRETKQEKNEESDT